MKKFFLLLFILFSLALFYGLYQYSDFFKNSPEGPESSADATDQKLQIYNQAIFDQFFPEGIDLEARPDPMEAIRLTFDNEQYDQAEVLRKEAPLDEYPLQKLFEFDGVSYFHQGDLMDRLDENPKDALIARDSEGKVLWKFLPKLWVGDYLIDPQEKQVFFGEHIWTDIEISEGPSHLYAIDLTSGKKNWSADLSGAARSLFISDQKLLVGADDGTLYCFDKKTGKEQWKIQAAGAKEDASNNSGPHKTLWVSQIRKKGNMIYFLVNTLVSSFYEGAHMEIIAVDIASGESDLLFDPGQENQEGPPSLLVGDDTIVALQENKNPAPSKIVAYDFTAPQVRWQKDLGNFIILKQENYPYLCDENSNCPADVLNDRDPFLHTKYALIVSEEKEKIIFLNSESGETVAELLL